MHYKHLDPFLTYLLQILFPKAVVNKDKIQEYNSEHIFCDCGCSVSRNNILRHKRTPQHQEIMEEIAKGEKNKK